MNIAFCGDDTLRLKTRVWSVASATAPNRAMSGVITLRLGDALFTAKFPEGASGIETFAAMSGRCSSASICSSV
jgi:hypothetical protein